MRDFSNVKSSCQDSFEIDFKVLLDEIFEAQNYTISAEHTERIFELEEKSTESN